MRFNDLFATILSGPAESGWSRTILWRQCVDLLAQYAVPGNREKSESELAQVATTLEGLRDSVASDQKIAALHELGGRLRSPRLVRILMGESVPVQIAVMRQARLPDAEWPSIIAEASPLVRSILRERPDMGTEARRALDAFGLSDLTLVDLNAESREELILTREAETLSGEEEPEEQSQIRRIVDRIERFTSERQDRVIRDADPVPSDPVSENVAAFTFLTDVDGVISSVQGAPRAHLGGQRLATASLDRSIGPDGQILGAFRRRGAFREGRLTFGDGPMAGCWLVDGDPLFEQRSGRFTGYRGSARRAVERDLAPQSSADIPAAAIEAPAMSHSTSMRQLIHELRSPLSGVMGFAELIETQMLGPVGDNYRSMAGHIVDDVRMLVDILDDLDLANRNDRLAVPVGEEGTDAVLMLREILLRLGRDADGRMRILLDREEALPNVDVAPAIVERMIAHLIRAVAGCVGSETLSARLRREGNCLLLEIDRPLAMAGLEDEALFDSGFEHVAVNGDAPVLGVGFALRLARRLAQANRGSFVIHPGYFALSLPVPIQAMGQEVLS